VENFLTFLFSGFFIKTPAYLQSYPPSFTLIHIKFFFSWCWYLLLNKGGRCVWWWHISTYPHPI